MLSGKVRIAPFQSFPAVSASEDCAAIHAQAAAPVEEEIDLADILGEDVGEDASARAAAAEEEEELDASALEEAEKRELELKRKKAMEEIAKLNKASNKSRRRRRRSKKSKEEL